MGGNVDLQAGVRRGWSRHCPPQMLLSHSLIPQQAYVLVVYFFLLNLMFPLFDKKKHICIQNLTGKICPIENANVIYFVSFLLLFLKINKRGVFFLKKKKKKKKKS